MHNHARLFFVLSLFINANLFGQSKTSGNSGVDSLKKDINNIKQLFKKAGVITINIEAIDSTDKNLSLLRQNVQTIQGVKQVSVVHRPDVSVFTVLYKGKGSELWDAIPQNSRQIFSPVTITDSVLELKYKYAKVASAGNENVNTSTTANQQTAQTTANSNNAVANTEQQPALSKGAALLFKNVKSKLGNAEKNKIFDSLGFKISKDAKQFISDAESADFPFDAFAYPTDLNKDDKEEIFILFGNTYTSGNTGSSVALFVADKNGIYRSNLGFPGTLPDVLATSNSGYPDLLIGGPGMEFPVYRWNGKMYDYFKSVKDSDYEKLKPKSLEELSKTYTSTVKTQ